MYTARVEIEATEKLESQLRQVLNGTMTDPLEMTQLEILLCELVSARVLQTKYSDRQMELRLPPKNQRLVDPSGPGPSCL